MDFCTSGYISSDEITKIRLSEGRHVLPIGLVTNVLLRVNQRFYDSDASYLKNVFAAEPNDKRPHFFARLLILRLLLNKYNAPGIDRMKGYVRVANIRDDAAKFGVDVEIFRRELEYLIRAFCVVCEDFRVKDITDDDLVSIAPAGHVHCNIYSEHYYLAAVAEDSWFSQESVAQQIASRIEDPKAHYAPNTVLENAESILDELENHRLKEVAAYSAIFGNDDIEKLIDLSAARSKLIRFESEVAGNVWRGANKRFLASSVHNGRVRGTADFGVFVELEPGLDGLIHSSKLPENFKTNKSFERGKHITVSVVSVNRVERRVDLDWLQTTT